VVPQIPQSIKFLYVTGAEECEGFIFVDCVIKLVVPMITWLVLLSRIEVELLCSGIVHQVDL
jgi:hypothetical protein